MVILWNETRIKAIPVPNAKMVILLPGGNEVPGLVWQTARQVVLPDIKSGRIEEVEAVVEEANGASKLVRATAFNKLSATRAAEIAALTYSLSALNAWREKEVRDEVRALLLKQIDIVKNHGNEE